MIQTDEDDEFDRILRENRIRGQAYHFPEPRIWTGLTNEEIKLQWSVFWEAECHPWAIDFAKAIEAKLKGKNT